MIYSKINIHVTLPPIYVYKFLSYSKPIIENINKAIFNLNCRKVFENLSTDRKSNS